MWNIIRTDALDKRKYLIFITFVALVITTTNGQRRFADTDPSRISTQVGDKIDLMCRFGSPIFACKFNIPGEPLEVKLNPNWNRNDNFRYNGTGLENGQCGISIQNVRREYHGNASCALDLNDGTPDVIGFIEIIIAVAPQLPELEVISEDLDVNSPMEATCVARDGRPEAAIFWYIGEKQLQAGQPEISDNVQDNTTFSTIRSNIRESLTPDDDGKDLICRAEHAGYPNGFSETRHQLQVKYRPIALPEQSISDLIVGNTAAIVVTLRANPRPRLRWTIAGKTVNMGEQTDRFVANEPVSLGNGFYNATLIITQLTLEDTTVIYSLRADNAFGSTDYRVRIGGSSALEGGELGIIPIIAISIIALFVLVIVALIIVAKVTKRWCFAGDSMHPNGPDSEAQIAPDDDKTHEQYEQHEKSEDEEQGAGDAKTNGNGNSKTAKGNTSV